VCVLNRKGRARLLACVACGELTRCEACGAAVIETDEGLLACPRCATIRPKVCLHCHATRMKAVRPGVARLREDLSALLPRATVVEVEAATEEIPPADVLVGTEAVLHRVPVDASRPVRLVAFLDADQELLAPRVHAAEQALWLMVRAARLVGPRSGPGRILIQTRVPDHEVLDAVRHGDPTLVAEPDQARRQALGYPPFGGLVELSGAAAAVDALALALRSLDGISVLGPVEVGAGKRALAQGSEVATLCDALAESVRDARSLGRLRVEVDPLRV
jgi:primosomal protein N' (replication factor Y)